MRWPGNVLQTVERWCWSAQSQLTITKWDTKWGWENKVGTFNYFKDPRTCSQTVREHSKGGLDWKSLQPVQQSRCWQIWVAALMVRSVNSWLRLLQQRRHRLASRLQHSVNISAGRDEQTIWTPPGGASRWRSYSTGINPGAGQLCTDMQGEMGNFCSLNRLPDWAGVYNRWLRGMWWHMGSAARQLCCIYDALL